MKTKFEVAARAPVLAVLQELYAGERVAEAITNNLSVDDLDRITKAVFEAANTVKDDEPEWEYVVSGDPASFWGSGDVTDSNFLTLALNRMAAEGKEYVGAMPIQRPGGISYRYVYRVRKKE